MANNSPSAHHQRLIEAFSSSGVLKLNEPNPIFNLLREAFYQEQVNEEQSGCFMPVAFPTGVGKTFNTLSIILEAILDDINRELTQGDDYVPKYCYYITNSVDNVYDAYSHLIKRVEESSELNDKQKQVILERILYAPANSRSLLDLQGNDPETLEKIMALFSVDKNVSLAKELDQIKVSAI